jgi:hypothetical protein
MEQHGQLANIEAAARADAPQAKGDLGRQLWRRILRAVEAFQRMDRAETQH